MGKPGTVTLVPGRSRTTQRETSALEASQHPNLAKRYQGLLACEARHFQSYVVVARTESIVD
jgi:tRNA isopentenyl-2-thiomethyl-A-37 hydroxylase MiaE